MITVGIVDYGAGNHASVTHALRQLGYKVRFGCSADVLDMVDVIVLPGVGAYPSAMEGMESRGLVKYLRKQAAQNRPMLGICLGMQLLATEGYELGHTPGLDIIPGKVTPLRSPRWHIGWNSIEHKGRDPLLVESDREIFYFNHSFIFDAPEDYVVAVSHHGLQFNSIVRRGKVAGVQFHPEKSQLAGNRMLKNIIESLYYA